jgi:hypothetical protein
LRQSKCGVTILLLCAAQFLTLEQPTIGTGDRDPRLAQELKVAQERVQLLRSTNADKKMLEEGEEQVKRVAAKIKRAATDRDRVTQVWMANLALFWCVALPSPTDPPADGGSKCSPRV